MNILLNIEKYAEKITSEGLSESDFNDILNSLEFEGEISIKEVNIGPGADAMVILLSILTVVNVFAIGDRIDKGIDGWINLGKRLKKFFDSKELVAVDKDGASLLAIEFISNIVRIESIEKHSSHSINLVDLFESIPDGRSPDELITKPFNYFIESYIINSNKLYVLGIKSSGEVNQIKCFEYGWPYSINEI